ncbi:MAG: helix-turn-helix domain-containing protein [Gammaproteobacteria bacterium]|nr:helix-turn-helix domain-containing protein [Gammaproteobacteria bacterium]
MRTAKFVQSYFDAWNHRDPEAVAHHLAADGTYLDVPDNEQVSRDELIVDLHQFFADYRHRYELLGDILEGRNTIAFQYRMYPPGAAQQAAEGCIYGAEFMTLRGDSARTITDYYEIPGAAKVSRFAGLASRRSPDAKYAKSGLTKEQLATYKSRLERVMNAERVYLRPNLTLPELAKAVGCSVNHLSQVINAGFGMSFFDYVNRYRVDHAKALLSELDGNGDSVLNIAFSVGFNSNSAFYTAFKKRVGQAPAQYRRGLLRRAH